MTKTKLSDSSLISLYKKGNEEAFSFLVNKYSSKVFSAVYLIVKDKYIAEDITQEVFIKIIKTIKNNKYNEEGKFQPWMMRIAHNLSIDHFRKEKKYPKITLNNGNDIFNSLTFSENNSESHQENKESKKLLQQLIKELPKKQKEVLVMRHFMEMSFQDIAESTNVSINTALGRMRYALINLRKKLKTKLIAYD